MANALGGGSVVNADGTISASTYTVGGSTVNNIGDAITNVDGRVTQNTNDVSNLASQIGSGTLGLVQQATAGAKLTVGAATGDTAVDFTGTDGARVLTGVANGTGDTDAVTMAQLKASGLYDPNGDPMTVISYDDHTLASATLGGLFGTTINNLAPGLIAAGSMQAINGGQLFDVQATLNQQIAAVNNNLQGQLNDLASNIGDLSDAVAEGGGGGNIPGGPGSGPGSVEVGEGASASGDNSTATGNGSVASGDNSTATGNGAVASGNNSTATGSGSVASGSNSTAVGANAQATGENSTALGANSSATASNSVALGESSVADRANSVSVASVGNERQITNVAAGTSATDAVNAQQLNDVRDWAQNYTDQRVDSLQRSVDKVNRRASGGTAAAMAMANLPQAYAPNQRAVSAGAGTFNGQSAVAIGLSTISESGRWVFRASATTNTQGDTGAGWIVMRVSYKSLLICRDHQ